MHVCVHGPYRIQEDGGNKNAIPTGREMGEMFKMDKIG